MKTKKFILNVLLLFGCVAAFGQQLPTEEEVLKREFGKLQVKMISDACSFMEYYDETANNLNTSNIDAFFNKLYEVSNNKDEKQAISLKNIIEQAKIKELNYSGNDYKQYIKTIKDVNNQLYEAYKNEDWKCLDVFKTIFVNVNRNKIKQKKQRIEDSINKYNNYIDALNADCERFRESEVHQQWALYITKGGIFQEIAVIHKNDYDQNQAKQNDEDAAYAVVTACHSYSDVSRCEEFLQKYPNSKYTKEVKTKKQILEALTYAEEADNNYTWPVNNKTYYKSGTYYEEKNGFTYCLNLTITKPNTSPNTKKPDGASNDNSGQVIANTNNNVDNGTCNGTSEAVSEMPNQNTTINNTAPSQYNSEVKPYSPMDKQSVLPVKDDDDGNGSWLLYCVITIIAVLIIYLVTKKKQPVTKPEPKQGTTPKQTPTPKSETVQEPQPAPEPAPTPSPEPKQTPKPQPEPQQSPASPTKATWLVVGASVKGNGHIQSGMPCQDNNKFEDLGNGWGIAIVADGAGSAAHSEIGSKVVVERGVLHFKELIEKEGWMKNNALPTDIEWLQRSYSILKTIRNEVVMVADKNKVEPKSLSSTCLVVIYTPIGLLAAHVGDGRMGYKTMSGEWKSMMTPHKGDEANQTLFLLSDFWDIPNYVQSGVLVPESIVIREQVKAFTLMSDGCENTSWLCTTQNPETGKYYDQNQPYDRFFNPLEETLINFHNDNMPEEARNEKWYKFIESGATGFVKETDDKTMIFGLLIA